MYDVVIVGAGASGLYATCNLRSLNKKISILLLEKNDKVGKKLLITGNGRCNLGNNNIDIKKYNSNSSLERFKEELEENRYLKELEKFGILPKSEEELIYPYSNQASSVVKAFGRYIEKNNVNIKYNYRVESIKKEKELFEINNDIKCKYLIIATGGLSYPKTGSTGDGFDLLKNYHKCTNLYPSLVPVISNYKYLKDLSGVRFNSNVKLVVNDKVLKEEIGQVQYTDYGLSGICIFNISRDIRKYLQNKDKVIILIDLIPDLIDKEVIAFVRKFDNYRIEEALSNVVNNKIANVISKELSITGKRVKDIKELDFIINKMHNFEFKITDTKDFNSSQITSGGFVLDEFTNFFESKKLDNLYVVGEILDCDGICGGYNLNWAFTTANLATKDIIKKLNK